VNYGQLASTGVTVSLFGVMFNQIELVGIAGGLVLAGALCIRVAFRRGKSPQDV
jgi:hypothetical protein